MDYLYLAQQCAPMVAPHTMVNIVRVESGFNPFAIGVVNGRLERQPRNIDEAIATARALEKAGLNFSLGAAQVNRYNLAKYNLDYASAFDPCQNLRAGSSIFKDCHDRARRNAADAKTAVAMALSCYWSGNFTAGFKPESRDQSSYVSKVLAGDDGKVKAIPLAMPMARKRTPTPAATNETPTPAADAWSTFGAKEI